MRSVRCPCGGVNNELRRRCSKCGRAVELVADPDPTDSYSFCNHCGCLNGRHDSSCDLEATR